MDVNRFSIIGMYFANIENRAGHLIGTVPHGLRSPRRIASVLGDGTLIAFADPLNDKNRDAATKLFGDEIVAGICSHGGINEFDADLSGSLVQEILVSLHTEYGHRLLMQWNLPETYVAI